MENLDANTEQAQYAIGVAIDSIRNSYVPLFEKKKELESLEQTPELQELILITTLRLDVLFKVEQYLLNPLKNTYFKIQTNNEIIQPGNLAKAAHEMNNKFVEAVMQGLLE